MPAAAGAQEGETVNQRHEPRQRVNVVVAGHGDDFDAAVHQPPHTFLQGQHCLEPGIGTLDDVARKQNRVHLLLDRKLDG